MAVIIVDDTGARRISCNALLNSYDAARATAAQMREYANCVHFLHPTTDEIQVVKYIVLIALFFTAIGALLGALFISDDSVIGGIIGGILGLVGLLLVCLVGWAVS